MRKQSLAILFLSIALSTCVQGDTHPTGALHLPTPFSNHMVLQRNTVVPVWGTALAGSHVVVTFAGQTKTTQADDKGLWQILLDPLTASDQSQSLVVSVSPADPKQPSVTIDDVLVGEVWVGSGQSNMATTPTLYTKDMVLRTNAAATYPEMRLLVAAENKWEVAKPETINSFSALLFSFGLSLHQTLHVPVGLMVGAIGGTASRLWISEKAYSNSVPCQEAIKQALAAWNGEPAAAAERAYTNALAAWNQTVAEAQAAGKPVPPNKPQPPIPPGEYTAGPNEKTGHLYERYIRPMQPYAIRGVIWDQGEAGTAIQGLDQFLLMGALIQGWRQDWRQGDFPFVCVQKPSGGGCAWDPTDPVAQGAEAFTPQPNIPPTTAFSAESYIKLMQYTNTFLVTTTDLAPGIHPPCKSGYGARVARVVLGGVYQYPIEIYGPRYVSHTVEGNKIRIRFDHIGQGLAARPADKLQGFAVAGADKHFYWANAVIEGDTVVVSSDKAPAPVAVRYAFGPTHPWANLFNKDGLPALMFRSDSW